MGRRQIIPKIPKVKKQKKGTSMYGIDYLTPAGNIGAGLTTISDTKTNKHFGILLSTQQAVDEFQTKSGMKKAFTTEYQYHYWALVGRVRIGEETLDIGIPTVLFNYKQQVNGAAVDFHLNDVEEASKRNQATAEIIGNVLIGSSFGDFMRETFGTALEWMNVPMNTCHVHPGQLASFSGTDYAKTINDPGICFPLAAPIEQPSFSSIICHGPAANGHSGKIVRTEYRNASKVGNVIKYLHGACFSYWKGHTIPGYKVKLPPLQAVFSNKEFDEKEDTVIPAYGTTDGNVVVEGNNMLGTIIYEFNKIEFSPHTEDILAERIVKMSHGFKQQQLPFVNHGHPRANNSASKYKTLTELRELLIKAGYATQVVYQWGYGVCEDKYKTVLELESINKPTTTHQFQSSVDEDDESTEMNMEEKLKFMLANGIPPEAIKGKNTVQIDLIFETLIEAIEEEEEKLVATEKTIEEIVDASSTNVPDYKANQAVISFLEGFGIAKEELMKLTNDDIDALLLDAGY